jgi:hypothetical protein
MLHPTFSPKTKTTTRGLLLVVDIQNMGHESLQVVQLSGTTLPLANKWYEYRLGDWYI